MSWWIYVELEKSYLRLEARNQWHLKIDVVNQVQRDFEVDEKDQFCVASAGKLIFSESCNSGYAVKGFSCLLDDESDLTNGVIKAGGFYLDSGESLFFEPSSSSGIRFGSEAQVYEWTSLLHYPFDRYKKYAVEI